MIGILCEDSEKDIVREFFELFKTPWEFCAQDCSYEIVISTRDEIPDINSGVVVVYGSEEKNFDSAENIAACSRHKNVSVDFDGIQLPIYGDVLSFQGPGKSLIKIAKGIMATGGNYLHQKIADVTTTHLEFPSGLKAHVFVSWLHPFKEQKFVVVGDRKMAVFDDTKPWAEKLVLYHHEIKWERGVPAPAKAEPEPIDIPQTEPLRSECKHFLESIMTGQRPQTDGHEGVRVLKVLNASQRSLDEHGKMTSLEHAVAPTRPTSMSATHPYFVHPKAVVDENVTIGEGAKIWHFSHILSGSRIGGHCNIGQNVVMGPDVTIGRNCKIQNNVSLYKGVTLENGVFCGPSMVFTNVYNPRAEIRKMDQVRPTLVKKGATIGANATIICGITIGRYAFVGAGAVVTKDVPDHALVVGNPAQQIGWVCECGEKLNAELVCDICGKKYSQLAEEKERITSSLQAL